MTDETRTPDPEENDVNEEPKAPEQGAEPEGGPLARQRAFLEERFATLGPKDVEEEAEPVPTPPAAAPEEEAEPAVPTDFRLKLMEQYRQLQRAQLVEERGFPLPEAEEEQPGSEEEEEEGDSDDDAQPSGAGEASSSGNAIPPPPQPPQPPPANNWIPIGPSVLRQGQGGVKPATSGRTVGIAVVPGGNRVYIAAANGGVWRSEDAGRTWRSLMDAFDLNPTQTACDSLACGAIAVVPGATANQDRIYVGSGEGQGGAYFGVGPIVSTNGGASWPTEPVAPGSQALAGSAFYALAVDPANIDRVVAATRRGIYRREPRPSPASGFHWAQKNLPGAGSIWATSVVVARTGTTTTFYAATWFGPVYSSTDGHTWTQVGTGFPTANVGRIGLAVQPNNPSVVYALIHNSINGAVLGIWRLDTSDNTWRQISGHPADLFGAPPYTQGSYDLAIAVDPNNVNRIYLGGSTRHSGGDWSGCLYRSTVTSSGSGASLTYSMSNTYIGNSVHADIHTIVFAPGDSNKLWVGCDGGAFYSTNPTGSGNIFKSRNTGLATLTMEHLSQHPTEDAVVFCGAQDNGTVRYTGEEAWLYIAPGDGGFSVTNWADPYKVLVTYPGTVLRRFTDGGTRYNYTDVRVSASGDKVLFYAPLAGTPRNTGSPAQAERVAFGTNRVWISDTFGGNWKSIPNNSTSDRLGSGDGFRIKSLAFASYNKLYAGTMNGRVYRFEKSASGWNTPTRIDNAGGLPGNFSLPVTDIAVDPADTSGNSIYVTFGGIANSYRRVWHFNGTQWQQRSGPAANPNQRLLDVQHNAVVVDPANTSHVYVGADIGVWRSTDGGSTWKPFSYGLPDAAVIDMKLHNPRRLLRASTHGRGVFERTLDTGSKMGVELYVRDTQLDQGRFTTTNWLPDPTQQGQQVRHWRGPDIKLDTPDTTGSYQFPLTGTIDFFEFVDTLSDDFQNVATYATATITTRVYVQVHNRGVTPANNVRVMLLLSNASAGLPALPAGYATSVQNGTPINTANWKTIGFATLNDVRVGFPKIAAFNLTSDKLPLPANLAGNDHHCVLALVHHANDQYTSTVTHTDNNSKQERKAAHKNLKVVQFTGTPPTPPPVIIPVRIHNGHLEEMLLTSLLINLNGYPGRARLFIPPMETEGHIEDLIEGMFIDQDFEDFEKWAEQHIEMIERNQASEHPYDKLWAEQRIEDIQRAMELGFMLGVEDTERVALHRIVMEPDSYHTVFLMIDRPEDGQIGEAFDIEVTQLDDEREELIGGLATRVELVPEPEVRRYSLELWNHRWLWGYEIIRARLYDAEGESLTPDDGAEVELVLQAGDDPRHLGPMPWHRAWRSFYYFLRVPEPSQATVVATGLIDGSQVAEAQLFGL